MKKIFLMIGAAIGALFPFGRANADSNCTYEYSYWVYKNNMYAQIRDNTPPTNYSYTKHEICVDTNDGITTSKVDSSYSCKSNGICNSNPSSKEVIEYEYDSNGNKASKVNAYYNCFNGTCSSNPLSKEAIEYDANGNQKSKVRTSYSCYNYNSANYKCNTNPDAEHVTKYEDGNKTSMVKTYYSCNSNNDCNKYNQQDYEYDNGDEISKNTYTCDGDVCTLSYVRDYLAEDEDTRYKYYDCNGDECTLVGTSKYETGYACNYDISDRDCRNIDKYTCSNGTCYATATSYTGDAFFYDNSGNVSGGYSETCGSIHYYASSSQINAEDSAVFTCSNGRCYCENDHDKTVEIPDEYLKSPASFDMPEVTNCGDKYYIKNEYTCSKCPSGSETCYMNDNGQLVTDCKSGYKEQGGGCVTTCDSSYRDMGEWCNKIRWTPAEAAQVLRNDNTNEVTITFRK